jgi:hypothetical protein
MTRLSTFFGASVFLAVILSAAALHRASMSVRGGSVNASTKSKQQIMTAYGKLPLSFESNRGQTDSRVKFISRVEGRYKTRASIPPVAWDRPKRLGFSFMRWYAAYWASN